MNPCAERKGFSLVEVTMAVGVFALATVALIGFGSTLLRDAGRAENHVELESFLRALEGWLDREATADYADAVDRVGRGQALFAWKVDPSHEEDFAEWRFGSLADLELARDSSTGGRYAVSSVVANIRLGLLEHLDSDRSPNYQPVEVELRFFAIAPSGAVDAALNEDVERLPRGRKVRTVLFR